MESETDIRQLGTYCLLLLAIAAGTANAGVTIQSVSRSISGSVVVSIEGLSRIVDGDQLTGPPSGPWETGMSAINLDLDSGIGFAFAEAEQTSDAEEVGPAMIRLEALGFVGGGADVEDPGFASSARSAATSSYQAVFVVSDKSHTATLDVILSSRLVQRLLLSGSSVDTPTASYSLVGGTQGAVSSKSLTDTTSDGDFPEFAENVQLILAPDVYTLRVEAAHEAIVTADAVSQGTAAFYLELIVVPVPRAALPEVTALFTVGFIGQFRRRRSAPVARRLHRSALRVSTGGPVALCWLPKPGRRMVVRKRD